MALEVDVAAENQRADALHQKADRVQTVDPLTNRRHLQLVKAWLMTEAADVFAGHYVVDELVFIGLTGRVREVMAEARSLHEYPWTLRAFAAKWTLEELDAVAQRIGADEKRLADAGVVLNGGSVDARRNVLEVVADPASSSAARAVLERYGPMVVVTTGDAATAVS